MSNSLRSWKRLLDDFKDFGANFRETRFIRLWPDSLLTIFIIFLCVKAGWFSNQYKLVLLSIWFFFSLLCKGGWFSYQFRNKAWARNMFKIILLFSALLFLAEARPQSCKFCNIFLEKQTKYLNLTITIVLSIFSLSCLGCRSPGKGMSCRILCKRPKQVCSRNIRKWTRSLFFVNEKWPSKMISHSFESLTNKQITNVDEQKNWRWSRFDSSIFMS